MPEPRKKHGIETAKILKTGGFMRKIKISFKKNALFFRRKRVSFQNNILVVC